VSKRRRLLALPLAAVVAAAALGAGPAVAGRTLTVELGTSYYAPAKATVKQGERVRFRWNPSLDMHDVNVKSGPAKFESPLQASGTWTTRRLVKPGRYVLYCSQHEDMGMTLVVKRVRRS
jgi:plastocyanin